MTAKKRKPLDSPENQFVYNVQESERAPTPATPEPTPTPPFTAQALFQLRKLRKRANQKAASLSERADCKVHRRSARIAAPQIVSSGKQSWL